MAAIAAAVPSIEAVILSLGTSKEIINQAIDNVEGVSLQETSVKLLAVQNQIDLTYKISSTIFRLSFAQYL